MDGRFAKYCRGENLGLCFWNSSFVSCRYAELNHTRLQYFFGLNHFEICHCRQSCTLEAQRQERFIKAILLNASNLRKESVLLAEPSHYPVRLTVDHGLPHSRRFDHSLGTCPATATSFPRSCLILRNNGQCSRHIAGRMIAPKTPGRYQGTDSCLVPAVEVRIWGKLDDVFQLLLRKLGLAMPHGGGAPRSPDQSSAVFEDFLAVPFSFWGLCSSVARERGRRARSYCFLLAFFLLQLECMAFTTIH